MNRFATTIVGLFFESSSCTSTMAFNVVGGKDLVGTVGSGYLTVGGRESFVQGILVEEGLL